MRCVTGIALACCALRATHAQPPAPPAFEVASIKRSSSASGGDGAVTIQPTRFAARHATLQRLLFEAWQIPYAQIMGPPWLRTDEFEVDARSETAASVEQIRSMLRTLLTDRFKLVVRTVQRERRVYLLLAGKDGLHAGRASGAWARPFHGTLAEFANILAVQLSIPNPVSINPAIPSRATGAPVPVLDQTGIAGAFELSVELQPEPGADTFTLWQRALREQLGLRLESRRAAVPILIVQRAVKIPAGN
jgi:uncharacterized protein (TIGR03435 family)